MNDSSEKELINFVRTANKKEILFIISKIKNNNNFEVITKELENILESKT